MQENMTANENWLSPFVQCYENVECLIGTKEMLKCGLRTLRYLLNNKVASFGAPHNIMVCSLIEEITFGVTSAVLSTDPVNCFVCFVICEIFSRYVIFHAFPNSVFLLMASYLQNDSVR